MNIFPLFLRRRIAHRPNLLKIVDNIGWLFFDKILRMGVGLLVGVWVARYLGPAQFGLLNFAFAFIGLFGAISTLGLQGIVVRDVVREPESARLTLGTSAMLQLMGGLVSYLLILGAIAYVRPDDALSRTIVAILGAMMLLKASEIAVYWFESQVQSKYTVWVQNSVFLVFAALKVCLILLKAPLTAFVWAMLAEAAFVTALLLLVFNLRGPKIIQLQASIVRAQALLKDSWPLILSGIAITLYMKLDQIMLGQMIGDEAVGIYSAALRISEIWYLIPTIVVSSISPTLAKLHASNQDEFYRRLQQIYGLLVKVAFGIGLAMIFISEKLVLFIFGSDFLESSAVLVWHIWGGIFVFFGIAWSNWLILEGNQKIATQIHIFSLISNIILNYFFINLFGTVGAAMATVISYSLGHTVFMLFYKSQRIAVKMFFKSFI